MTPGVGDMVLTLSNLSQFFTFFPLLVVKWWVWYTLSECGRSLLIGCAAFCYTKNTPPGVFLVCCSSVIWIPVADPFVVCRAGEYVAEMEKCCPQASSGRQPRRGWELFLPSYSNCSGSDRFFPDPCWRDLATYPTLAGRLLRNNYKWFSWSGNPLIRKLHYTDISGYKGKAQGVTAILAILKGTG